MIRRLGASILLMCATAACGNPVDSSTDIAPRLSPAQSHQRHLSPHLAALARLEAAHPVRLATANGSNGQSQGPATTWERIGPHRIVQRGSRLSDDDLLHLSSLLQDPQSFEWPRPAERFSEQAQFALRLECGESVILLHYLSGPRILALTDGFNGDAWARAGDSLAAALNGWRAQLDRPLDPK